MKTYYKTTFLYVYFATAVTVVLHDDKVEALEGFASLAGNYVEIVGRATVKLLPAALLLGWALGRKLPPRQLRNAFLVACAAVMIQVGFLFFKSAIPRFVPFYADPFWAELDRLLLFGNDAWRLAQAITPDMLVAWFPHIYLTAWSLLAYAFPIMVAAADPDEQRLKRYAWLYFLSWLVTGNLVALAGSSVGPVFYDRLMGTHAFDDLRAALDLNGFSSGPIANLQQLLWENSGQMLSYISAFPSVHVAVACIAAIYIRERFRHLRLLGDVFCALTLLISVYSGYHYLVDGLASIGIVILLHVALSRHLRRRVPGTTGAGSGAFPGQGVPIQARAGSGFCSLPNRRAEVAPPSIRPQG